MWKKKIFDGSNLGLSKPFTFLHLNSIDLPRLDIKGEITSVVSSEGYRKIRAKLEPTGRSGGGGHSILEENWRSHENHSERELVLLKKPKDESISLRTEGFIQWLANKAFSENNLQGRIPTVHEILELPDKTEGFTMREILNSERCSSFLINSTNLQKDILHVLVQISILLQLLEDTLALDHRDLKADNLLIQMTPSILTFNLPSHKTRYTIKSPFTVCIVDFGFACLGDVLEGITIIDAGEGTLPPLDPCPKDGRDLYHLIVSLYSITAIHDKLSLSPELDNIFKTWMEVKGKETHNMARKWSHSEWIYLLTSSKDFTHPTCTPKAVIERIISFEPNLFI